MKPIIIIAACCSAIQAMEESALPHSSSQIRAASMAGVTYASEEIISVDRRRSSTVDSNENSPIAPRKANSIPLLPSTNYDTDKVISITTVADDVSSYLDGAFYIHSTTAGYHIMWNRKGAKKQAHLFHKYKFASNERVKIPNKLLKSDAKWFATKYKLQESRYIITSEALDKNFNQKRVKTRKKQLLAINTFGKKQYLTNAYKLQIEALIAAKALLYKSLSEILCFKNLDKLNHTFIEKLDDSTAKVCEIANQAIRNFGGQPMSAPKTFADIHNNLNGFRPVYIKRNNGSQKLTVTGLIEIDGLKLEIFNNGEKKLTCNLDKVKTFIDKRNNKYDKIHGNLSFDKTKQQLLNNQQITDRVHDSWKDKYHDSKKPMPSTLLQNEIAVLATFEFQIYSQLKQLLHNSSQFSRDMSAKTELIKNFQNYDRKAKAIAKTF